MTSTHPGLSYVVRLAAVSGVLASCTALERAGADDPDASTKVDPGDEGGQANGKDGSSTEDASGPDAPVASGPCTFDTCITEPFLDTLYAPVAVVAAGTYVSFVEVGTTIPMASGKGWLSRVPTSGTCKARDCFQTIDDLLTAGETEGQLAYNTRLAVGGSDICYVQSYASPVQHKILCFDLQTLGKRALATGAGAVQDLWIGAAEARWAMGGGSTYSADSGVRAKPLVAGSVKPVVGGRISVLSVASDGTSTFLTELGASVDGGGLVGVALPDAGVYPLSTGRSFPTRAAVHAGYVYWVEKGARKIMRVKADGTAQAEVLASTRERPDVLRVDPTGVYWIDIGATKEEGAVEHTGLTGGQVDLMMKDLVDVYGLSVDDTHVYVSTAGAQPGGGTIVRMTKTR